MHKKGSGETKRGKKACFLYAKQSPTETLDSWMIVSVFPMRMVDVQTCLISCERAVWRHETGGRDNVHCGDHRCLRCAACYFGFGTSVQQMPYWW